MNFTEKLLDASRKNNGLQNFGFQVISQASGFSRRCLLLLLLPRTLEASRQKLEPIREFNHDSLESVLRPLAEELGLKTGQLFGTLRVAVTGRTAAPPLFETMSVFGRELCLERIEIALAKPRG